MLGAGCGTLWMICHIHIYAGLMDRLAGLGLCLDHDGVHEKDLHDYCTYFGTLVMFGLSLMWCFISS